MTSKVDAIVELGYTGPVSDIDGVIEWHGAVPAFTDQEIDTKYQELLAKTTKLSGVAFEGVMCSATAEDMWGLSSVKGFVEAGNTVKFYFSNGNVLYLTPENITAFESVWVPFRQSFFQ